MKRVLLFTNQPDMGKGMNCTKSVKATAIVILLCLFTLITAPVSSASFSPEFTTIRVGLYYGDSVLPSANLMNAGGYGMGFDFGYYDANRIFVPVGAWTEENRITVTMDRNMVWNPGGAGGLGEYQEGDTGSVVIGCFHVQLNAGYGSFEEAKAEAEKYEDAFVRYQSNASNPFLVLIGHHTTRPAAEEAIRALPVSGAAVNSGTSNTITVTRTGTSAILFEFDRGATPFGIVPRPIGGENPETWFRNYRYNGGFQYSRRDGGLLTIANMINIEDYVKGIIPYEMGVWFPLEALKAQALCSRTYAIFGLNRHGAHGVDLCTEVHCQVYRGRSAANETTDQAVAETAGMYITYNNQLVQAFYASSNGGASESVENVWNETIPYLRGVTDPYEGDAIDRVSDYYWTRTYSPSVLTQRMRDNVPGFNLSTIATMKVTQYSPTGNVLKVTFTDVNGRQWTNANRAQLISGLNLRTLRFDIGDQRWEPGNIFANDPAQPISPDDTQVSAIDGGGEISSVPKNNIYAITGSGSVEVVTGESTGGGGSGQTNGMFVIRGSGNGHQVGMSQWGAFSMALHHNKTFEEIIRFYFTGVEITRT